MSDNPYQAPNAALADPASNFDEYGEIGVLNIAGRIGRVRYIVYALGITFLGYIGIILGAVFTGMDGIIFKLLGGLLLALSIIGMLIATVSLAVQRIHDFNTTGWLFLLMFIPIVGSIFALLLLFIGGTKGANQYGPPPPPNKKTMLILAIVFVLIIPIVGIVAAIAIPAYQGYVEKAGQIQPFEQP